MAVTSDLNPSPSIDQATDVWPRGHSKRKVLDQSPAAEPKSPLLFGPSPSNLSVSPHSRKSLPSPAIVQDVHDQATSPTSGCVPEHRPGAITSKPALSSPDSCVTSASSASSAGRVQKPHATRGKSMARLKCSQGQGGTDRPLRLGSRPTDSIFWRLRGRMSLGKATQF